MPTSSKLFTNGAGALTYAAIVVSALIGVFMAVEWGRMPEGLHGFLALRITIENLLTTSVFFTMCTATFQAFGLSLPSKSVPLGKRLRNIATSCTVVTGFAWVLHLASKSGAFSKDVVFYFLPVAVAACATYALITHFGWVRFAQLSTVRRELIIVGSGPRAAKLYRRIRFHEGGRSRVLGFVDSPNSHLVPTEIQRQLLGPLDSLDEILMRQAVDEVLIALPMKSCYAEIQSAIRTCDRVGVDARVLFDIFQNNLAKPRVEEGDRASLIGLGVAGDDRRLLVKRCIDIAGAFLGVMICGPFMLAIALAIKLTSPGPVVFEQERYGFHKRRFRMYKFRTMVEDADTQQAGLESLNEKSGPIFKIKNDPRVTPLGRLLRTSSLDELPQFFNVLRGDMSLVGPRPMSVRDVSRFNDASLMRRFSVKPGMTCLWQVGGRSNTDFPEWIALDLKYIDNWSLVLDLQILAKTLPAVLAGKGAV